MIEEAKSSQMETKIQRFLRDGITAHQDGNLGEARLFYLKILKSLPNHPTANHNLGKVISATNNDELALPYFKRALDANPQIDQFWINYIKALINTHQINLANEYIARGAENGVREDYLHALRRLIEGDSARRQSSVIPKRQILSNQKTEKS